MSIEDTGIGMFQEVRQRMFGPFFATKTPGQDPGLGLAIVFAIVEQHRGFIDCRTQEGAGTCMGVWLPRHHEDA